MFKKIKNSTKTLLLALLVFTIILGSYCLFSTTIETQVKATTYASAEENYAYLSDLWNTEHLIFKESGWKDARALKVNQNEPGNLISLIVDGKITYFLNGVFAHATSTVIYDISEYQAKGFNTFSAYLGVDTYAASNGNGVKFTIYGSNDKDNKSNWTQLTSTGVMKGTSEAQKVTLNIAGYKYLILYAYDNGSNASDHAVYADAMIYNSTEYTPTPPTEIDWIKTIAAYDAELLKKSSSEVVTNDSLRLTLLQRAFVSRVDYSILQAWANSSSDHLEVLEWLFKDVNRLEQYLLGGTPTGGSYIKSLTVLSDIYKNHKEDFTSSNPWNATLQKLMFATSLTHATTISSWFSGENGAKVYSTGLGRYEAIKELFIGAAENKNWKQRTNDGTVVPYRFEWEQFQDLTVEEMRWVTDNNLSDEEFLWLNWYATITKMGKTQYSNTNANDRGEMNPYTYIYYGNGGNVGRDDYYTTNPMCGYKNEFYNPNARTENCYEKYQLNDWESLKTQTKSKPTLWIAFEEDGVCGTLMHVGNNLERVFGIPSAGLGQPAHGAYIYANRVKNETTGKYYTREWTTYNWVSDWDQSEKGERLLLNWGTRDRTTVFNSTYNLIYIPLAQKAINNYENYRISELYMLMADIQTEVSEKVNCYNKALEKIPYHITAWYKLLTLKVANSASSSELNTLGQQMMHAVGNAPTAIDELSNIIESSLGEQLDSYSTSRYNILTALTNATDDQYMDASGVRAVAKSLLGRADYKAPASFSFDDNILKLNEESFASRFEYALNYNDYAANEKGNVKWIPVEGKSVDLTSQLSNVRAESDIAVHLIGDAQDNVYIIDITETKAPTDLYANDLENKVIGATNKMEWKLENSDGQWTKFTENTIFEGQKSILVRKGATGTSLASNYVKLTFAVDPEADPTKKYISISRLRATASSQQNNSSEAASRAIDGNPNTYWHNWWNGADKDRWIQIEITDGPVELSKIDYVPRPGGGNGNYTKVKIETSLDGVNYELVETVAWGSGTSTKTYILTTPTKAKYVRLTAIESVGDFASAAMINLYENTVPHNISVNDLSVSYMMSGYVYNGEAKTPLVTVKNGEAELINGTHYTIEYQNNVNAGTGKMILTGLGIYEGTREIDFTISKALQPSVMPAEEMTATVDQDTLASLSGLPEGWSWKNPETKLKAKTTIDAAAEYKDKNNYEIYEFTVKVTQDFGHRPEITGPTEKLEFDISEPENIKDLKYLISLVTITDVEDNRDHKELDIQIDYDWRGELNWTKEGTYHIYFVVTDSDGNVTEYTLEFTIINTDTPRIDITEINCFTITIDDKELSYTGSELIPTITITDSDGHVLKPNTDYTLKFSGNVNAGTATVIITGVGVYSGGLTKTFTIKKAPKPDVSPDSTITISPDTKSLSEINLPSGWRWANENIELIEGENALKLIYAGDENHDPYEVEIIVIKANKVTEEEPDEDNKNNEPKPGDSNDSNNNGNNTTNKGNSNTNSNSANNSNHVVDNENIDIEDETPTDGNSADSPEFNNGEDISSEVSEKAEKVTSGNNLFTIVGIIIVIGSIILGLFLFLLGKKRRKEQEQEI